jgi:unsaturated rhamnogalacturonyl hydrolase
MKEQYKHVIAFADGLFAGSTPQNPAWHIEGKSRKERWNYVDGCMLKGAMDLYHATADKKYFEFVKGFIDYYVDDRGVIKEYDLEEYNCDHINEGKVLFDLYGITGDVRYKNAIGQLYKQLQGQPRTNAGNFWHKKIYPFQVWLDGLYMVQPFYVAYDMLFGGKTDYPDSIKQFENVFALMKDAGTGLFYHGYDESRDMFWANKETGLSPHFWSRAMGWYAMALVDTAEKLSEELSAEKNLLALHLKELVDAVLKMQGPEKMLYQVTDLQHREGNYPETSGTLGIAYSLLKGVRLGLLGTGYYDTGAEIVDAVLKEKFTAADGRYALKDIVLVSGLGGMPGKGSYKLRDGTFEYYISEPRVENDGKGVAPLLFALSEILRNESGIR